MSVKLLAHVLDPHDHVPHSDSLLNTRGNVTTYSTVHVFAAVKQNLFGVAWAGVECWMGGLFRK